MLTRGAELLSRMVPVLGNRRKEIVYVTEAVSSGVIQIEDDTWTFRHVKGQIALRLRKPFNLIVLRIGDGVIPDEALCVNICDENQTRVFVEFVDSGHGGAALYCGDINFHPFRYSDRTEAKDNGHRPQDGDGCYGGLLLGIYPPIPELVKNASTKATEYLFSSVPFKYIELVANHGYDSKGWRAEFGLEPIVCVSDSQRALDMADPFYFKERKYKVVLRTKVVSNYKSELTNEDFPCENAFGLPGNAICVTDLVVHDLTRRN